MNSMNSMNSINSITLMNSMTLYECFKKNVSRGEIRVSYYIEKKKHANRRIDY